MQSLLALLFLDQIKNSISLESPTIRTQNIQSKNKKSLEITF